MPSPVSIPPIPTATARMAHAVYSKSNMYLSIGTRLTDLLVDFHTNDDPTMEAKPHLGMPFLALVTFFQYLEMLSDRQAMEATRTRIDWKYALHLSINYQGLDPTALCVFRHRLLSQLVHQQEFQGFLERMNEEGFITESQERPLDALYVLTEVCVRTRLDTAMTGMQHALQTIATRHPEWLRRFSLPHWYRRYDKANRQADLTQGMEQLQASAESIGADITFLLEAITHANRPELTSLNDVQQLHQIWLEQFDPIRMEHAKLQSYCNFCGNLPEVFEH